MLSKRSLVGVRWNFHTLAVLFFMLIGIQAFAADPAVDSSDEAVAAGKTVFNANCKTCHRLDQKLVGPALRGATDRQPADNVKKFIKNSGVVLASGDAYYTKLYKDYNNTAMPAHEFLSDDDLNNLLAYIEFGDKVDPAAAAAAAAGTEGGEVAAAGGIPSEYLTVILVVLVVVLLLILTVLGLIISVLTKYLNKQELDEDDQEFVSQKFNLGKVLKSDGFIIIVTALVVALVAKTAIDGLYSVGVQQGYAPTQPIAYSHKLHAGTLEIECQYCHTGVEIGRSANIPSPNICMNCHTHVQNVQGKEGVSPEIQKIYDAVDNNTPIEWVRVHNLPDLAYFNHSQHVKVGGIECQTCHGPIQEMEVVGQHSALTMGWCIDCHRQTEIATEGNAYYDKLVQIHVDSKDALKVKDIGGLECAKCHY
ncbi:mono/diheme cytochrome c family protein/heme/copper-type cytochrome/quinol oxidase subunit 2 [Algoriphagus iocasae]|uniref:Mono/diheme cytochrome c family protein/heme/copper-type cytochrome/quinol oxidase subunit 2 n=1 Tax=Algoriphagus iocasae TaxID=1836499 RepID=A0A841N1K4_9BACT|nr:c-type cytochrome [Algoriphagus iocasae]MBB6328828.1 mono/diheme cytochrome c family protein/heme/copper-type cytochrome/quinol oxidase subunit 2 [Algoriphagus iocasae]